MKKKKSLVWQNCSEQALVKHLGEWLGEVSLKNAVILLEGEMGAGKSAFARALLSHLSPTQNSQGSPTYPLIQTYQGNEKGAHFMIYHLDLYRLKNEQEFEDSGVEAQIEEQGALALVEWPHLMPSFYAYWTSPLKKHLKTVWKVQINGAGEVRDYFVDEILHVPSSSESTVRIKF